MSIVRKVSTNPTGSKFIYLPKSWYNQHVQNGWDGKQVTITPTSKLTIKPLPFTKENFIQTRTPLRLPLAGGGSDIPEYYTTHEGGYWISGAITHYIRVLLKTRFEEESKIVFSKTQYIKKITDINHPILQFVFQRYNLLSHLELISIADLPSRIGLGSSASFTVGLLKAVQTFLNIERTPQQIAEEAYDIERLTLTRKIGKQDQYIAVDGGINQYTITSNGYVQSQPLICDIPSLEKWLLLFYINQRTTPINKALSAMSISDYEQTSSLTPKIAKALSNNNFHSFGELIDQHWQIKKNTQSPFYNQLILQAKKAGAIGGKLCGAGGGGCILLVCPPEHHTSVIKTFQNNNLEPIPFHFESYGSEVYSNGI